MTGVLRIIDRFRITGEETVYMTRLYGQEIEPGEMLFDLHGNQFIVNIIDTFFPCFGGDVPREKWAVGITLTGLNETEVYGDYLVKKFSDISYIKNLQAEVDKK